MKMGQVLKSTKYFELFLRLEPWHRQGEHRKFKSRSDFNLNSAVNEYENGADD